MRAVAAALPDDSPTLALLPAGTANVLARELDLPIRPEPVAEMIAARHSMPLPVFEAGGTRFLQFLGAGLCQSGLRHIGCDAAWQIQKSSDGHRQRRIDLQFLWHITDPQPGRFGDLAGVGFHSADERAKKRGLPGTVRSDNGDDLARIDAEIQVAKDGSPAKPDPKTGDLDEAHS